jgi:hypothetical protein
MPAAASTTQTRSTADGGVFALIRDGAYEETTDAVRVLTGREPRTFAEFARDHAAAFFARAMARALPER